MIPICIPKGTATLATLSRYASKQRTIPTMAKKPKALALEHVAQHGCADLLEIVLFAPQGANEQDFVLGADVRFGSMLVSSEDWSRSVEIGLAKATLSLEFKGCDIDPTAQRLGDQKPFSAKTHVEHRQTSTKTLQMSAEGQVGATSVRSLVKAAGALSVAGKRASAVSHNETHTLDTRDDPVVSLSGNRWRFSSVAQTHMQSRYAGDEALCKVRVKTSPIDVEGRLSFQPKDIRIIDVEAPTALLDRFKMSPTKVAIAKILLMKHLQEINPITERGEAAVVVGCISKLRGEIKGED